MGLVKLIGVGPTRVAAQIAAALAGLLVIVMVQWDKIFGTGPKDALVAAYVAQQEALHWALLTIPARALTGDPVALMAALALAALFAAVMFVFLAERFVRNAVLASSVATSGPVRSRRSRASFGRSPFASLMLKERRVILRDPWLMSQILMQCIFLLPVAIATVWRVSTGQAGADALSPVLIVLCGQIAGGLTWIALSADEASELAVTAPIDPGLRARARLAAVAWLAAVFAATPLMLILMVDAWTGLVSLAGVACAILAGILVNLWHQPRLARVGLIRRRSKSPVSVTLMELAALTTIAIAAWPLLQGNYQLAASGAVFAILTMLALFVARRRELA